MNKIGVVEVCDLDGKLLWKKRRRSKRRRSRWMGRERGERRWSHSTSTVIMRRKLRRHFFLMIYIKEAQLR